MVKKVHIKTFGCQMNVYDSARMADVLAPLGFVSADAPDGADLVILNTCHIREKAAEKVFSELGRLRRLKNAREAAGGRMVLAVAGCVAQAEGDEIMARAPDVELVVGPQAYHRLPALLARLEAGPVLDTDFPVEPKFDSLPEPGRPGGYSAFLTVQEGCDKFCTFCVVPYTRGGEYSRPAAAVLAEARHLAGQGVREVTLLGQNVNAYHGPGPDGRTWDLARLIDAVAAVDGVERIRYTTSYPAEVTDSLIAAHRDQPRLMPFLHLPVQSGSDRILAAMNRRHTADDYRRLIERLRAARPDLALSSDFIVGFPGESEADFHATLDLIDEIGFVQAFSFRYSPRPGTPAAALGGRVPEAEAAVRLAAVQDRLAHHQQAFNRHCEGGVLPVLLERPGRHSGQLVGRSPYMQPVYVDAPTPLLGRVVPVHIAAGHVNSLGGILAGQPDPRAAS